MTRHFAANGAVTTTAYDDPNHLVIVTDAAGNTVTTQYDTDGNIAKVTDPLGNVTTYTHAPGTDHETSRTDPLGHTWQAAYDARGRRIGTVDPLGDTITIGYDATTGRQTTAVDGEGRTFTELTDANGRVTAFQMPDGTVVRSFSYPDPSTIVSADAHGTTTTTYDSRGRVISVTDGAGTRTTTYDDVHHTATFTAADGSVSSGTLDALQRFTTLNTASGGTFHYTYGPTPAVDQVTRPDGVQMKFEHSSGGQQTGLTIGGKPVQKVTYNSLGLLASVSQNGETKSYAYDPTGRVSQMTTAQGAIAYGYDAAGRLTDVTSSDGVSRVIAYDDANRPIGIDNGAGQRLEIAYDRSSRITGVADQNGRTYAVGYDADGRRDFIVYPGGVGASWTYVPSDDEETPPLATLSDLEGVSWAFGYDDSDRLASITDADGNTTSYERTPVGFVSKIVDALGRPTVFDWNGSRLDSLTTPGGKTQSYTYDAVGRTTAWTRADGSTVGYAYTPTSETTLLPSGGAYVRTFDDTTGLLATQGAPGGGVATLRNEDGQVGLLQVDDGGQVSVQYTPNGKVGTVTASTPGGAVFTTRYAYDSAARIAQITDPDGGVTHYTYDAQGRITRLDRPNGTHSDFAYGALDRPTLVQHYSGATLVASYAYGYDAHGRVVSLVSPEGSFAYQYDSLGRLAVEQTLNGATVVASKTRTYDVVGNLLTLVDSAAGTTTYTYDVDDRLLSASGPTDTTTYGYNLRGDLTSVTSSSGATTYAYDDLDRLVGVTLPGGEQIDYAYDVEGRLLSRTDGAGTRRCLPLPATPTSPDGCAAFYTPGGGPESPEALVFGGLGVSSVHGGGARYMFGASLGSVVGATDGAGNVVGSWGYDPWGVRVAATGQETGYGYAGERQDAATGLVFLRSRWYAPSTGRFLTPDCYGAESRDPRSLHRYVYALDNPLNRTDPTGQQSLCELSISISIDDILESIEDVIEVCVEENLKGQIYQAVATWATNKVVDALSDIVGKLVASFGPIPTGGFSFSRESGFHSSLADILCNGNGALASYGDLFEFEVSLDSSCGKRLARNKTHVDPANHPRDPIGAYSDCFSGLVNHTGIDIVFGELLGVELKLTSKTFKDKQLVRYCRFGARYGLHVFIYAFVTMPTPAENSDAAELCWKCWGSAGDAEAGACADTPTSIGSVYVAFGLNANGQDPSHSHVYVPNPSICKKN